MSRDLKTRLHALAEAMPPAPGDLDAVHRRARQRTRHGRVVGAVGAVVAVLAVGALLRVPAQPPPVIQGGQPVELFVTPHCPPQQCPELPSVVEEAAATLRDDPAVRQVEIVDPETRRRQMAEGLDLPPDQLPVDSFSPALRVVVRPGDEEIATLARRLHGTVPDVSVRRGPVGSEVWSAEGPDPAATAGPAHDAVEVVLGDRTITARMWPVAAGGRCVEVGDLVSCGVDQLLADHPGPVDEEEAWGRPEPDVTCAWAPVGDGIEAVTATFASGADVTGRIGEAPPGVLAGVALVCVDDRTHPVSVEYATADGGLHGGSIAPAAEVRPPDVTGWAEVAPAVHDQLPDHRLQALAATDDPAGRRTGFAATIGGLELPGVEAVRVYDTATGVYYESDDAPSTQVAAEVRTTVGDPICMVALLYGADEPRPRPNLLLDRPAVWTPDDGCPPLS